MADLYWLGFTRRPGTSLPTWVMLQRALASADGIWCSSTRRFYGRVRDWRSGGPCGGRKWKCLLHLQEMATNGTTSFWLMSPCVVWALSAGMPLSIVLLRDKMVFSECRGHRSRLGLDDFDPWDGAALGGGQGQQYFIYAPLAVSAPSSPAILARLSSRLTKKWRDQRWPVYWNRPAA